MAPRDSSPVVSVGLICDFDAGEECGWGHMRAALRALAAQDFDGPVDFLLVEAGSLLGEMPSDVKDVLPELRIVGGPEGGSYELKNEAARQARADLVVLLDADCVPEPDWLRRLVEGIRSHPEAVVLSAKTEYAGRRVASPIAEQFSSAAHASAVHALVARAAASRRLTRDGSGDDAKHSRRGRERAATP